LVIPQPKESNATFSSDGDGRLADGWRVIDEKALFP
jgi:hypothetical protein